MLLDNLTTDPLYLRPSRGWSQFKVSADLALPVSSHIQHGTSVLVAAPTTSQQV